MWRWLEKVRTYGGYLRLAVNAYPYDYEPAQQIGYIYYPVNANDQWKVTGQTAYNKYGLAANNIYEYAEETQVDAQEYFFAPVSGTISLKTGGLAFEFDYRGTSIGINTFVLGSRWNRLYGTGIMSFATSAGKRLHAISIAINDETEEAYVCVFRGSVDLQGRYTCTCTPIDRTKNYYSILKESIPGPDSDPNLGGGTSHPGGGGGSFDNESDPIDLPSVPAFSFVNSSLTSVYVPTPEQLDAFADYLWDDYSGGIKQLSKLFTNPLDSILSLHILPLANIPKGPLKIVVVGNYGTGIYMPPALEQFVDVDCGSINVAEYWGNYLDYNPYTKVKLELPYIGEVGLDPDEIMRETISIKYRIDILTGTIVAFVYTDTKVLAQYNAICQYNLPLSRQDYSALHNAHLSMAATAAGLAGAILTGGLTAPMAIGAAASTAVNVLNSKTTISHTGSLGGSSGFMGIQTPYLIVHRANQCLPANFHLLKGYPSYITQAFGGLSGYTEIEEVELNGLPFTAEELTELKDILMRGVIL